MSLEVHVDEDVCIGSANCVVAAPEAFVLDDDQIAQATAGVVDLADPALIAVARSCPSGAIGLTRDGEPVDIFAVSP